MIKMEVWDIFADWYEIFYFYSELKVFSSFLLCSRKSSLLCCMYLYLNNFNSGCQMGCVTMYDNYSFWNQNRCIFWEKCKKRRRFWSIVTTLKMGHFSLFSILLLLAKWEPIIFFTFSEPLINFWFARLKKSSTILWEVEKSQLGEPIGIPKHSLWIMSNLFDEMICRSGNCMHFFSF